MYKRAPGPNLSAWRAAARRICGRPMIERLFLAHPRRVGESYAEHCGVAWRFGIALIGAGAAALLHGLVPALCTRTASDAVRWLHAPLARRVPPAGGEPAGAALDWVI